MAWWDDLLNSSLLVYLILIIFIIHIYLKKTNQTLPDLFKRIKAAIQGEEDAR